MSPSPGLSSSASRLTDTLAFVRRFVAHYRQIGALVPSSQAVARVISKSIAPLTPGQSVIELGAGTGVFTRQLLSDYPQNPIIAVELDAVLAERLRQNCPTAHVVEGDAARLSAHLSALGFKPTQVGGIVSAIPFVALPPTVRAAIFEAMADVLPSGRPYAQITYFTGAWRKFALSQWFRHETNQRVWRNVPPAVVMRFVRR